MIHPAMIAGITCETGAFCGTRMAGNAGDFENGFVRGEPCLIFWKLIVCGRI